MNTIEKSRLTELEAVIQTGLNTFVEVGAALMVIRDSRLYRNTHSTFENYCHERWGMTRAQAYRLVQATEVVATLSPVGDIPVSERAVRPLVSLPPEQRQEVWNVAVESSGGKPTARHVEAAKVHVRAKPVPRDHFTLEEWEALRPDAKCAAVEFQPEWKAAFNYQEGDSIEWARWSWNPVTGCLHGCDYCYARDLAERYYEQKFAPTFLPSQLVAPSQTRPKVLPADASEVDLLGHRNVFTCSMADLFGKWVPRAWIEAVLAVVADNPQWTFLFLSKFPQRMQEFEFPDNAWVGTSVDKQGAVQRAERAFEKIQARVKWLSCEPMLERLTFNSLAMFNWVVIGGASPSTQTPRFVPPFDWISHLYQQARQAGARVYFKTNLLGDRVREYPTAAATVIEVLP